VPGKKFTLFVLDILTGRCSEYSFPSMAPWSSVAKKVVLPPRRCDPTTLFLPTTGSLFTVAVKEMVFALCRGECEIAAKRMDVPKAPTRIASVKRI
jgi:hypothetical protein